MTWLSPIIQLSGEAEFSSSSGGSRRPTINVLRQATLAIIRQVPIKLESVVTSEGICTLTSIRGPSEIIVMLGDELTRT